jgi:phage terminase Nu1 subunit (DNA packaging protein)
MAQITHKELANLLGVSSARLSQVKATGRLDGTWTKKGNQVSYDQDAAVKAWNYENPTQQDSTRTPTSELEIPTFNESRAKSEYFRAEMSRLDLEEKEEKLCDAEKVKREAFSLARSVRDALNSIPDRVANQFAAETDSVVIHQALSEELRKALERLTDA